MTVYNPLFFRKIGAIARELRNGCHLCLYCERNLERGRQSTEGAGVGEGWRPGCARNINKDGARFGVRVRSQRSYGKIEDCIQSNTQTVEIDFQLVLQELVVFTGSG